MTQYVLLEKIQYEGIWILGVVSSLDEALEYLSQIDNEYTKTDYFEQYISFWIEEWDKTKRLRTYKYNNITHLLEKKDNT